MRSLPTVPAAPACTRQAFPAIDDEALSALLPGKAGLVQTKLSNRCVVYSLDGGNPLFFDPDGRGGLLPTVRPQPAAGSRLLVTGGWVRARTRSTAAAAWQGGASARRDARLSSGSPDFSPAARRCMRWRRCRS